jgi:hypothetical protein
MRASAIQQIISGWPQALHAPRAVALGFRPTAISTKSVRAFIEDDLEIQNSSFDGPG